MTNPPFPPPFPPERVLLDELHHRIVNELCSAICVVSLTAARSRNDEVKAALAEVTELLHHYAGIHNTLRAPYNDARMDAAAYLGKLCLSISRSKLDHMKIDLVFAASRVWLPSDRCWLLGLIVYELVTNAARHAFPDGNGEIRVDLARAGQFVGCRVTNNGSAPANFRPGRGLRIVDELTKALDGRFDQAFGAAGSASIVVFPSGGQQKRLLPIARTTAAATAAGMERAAMQTFI